MDKNLQTLLNICSVFGICLQNPKWCGEKGPRIFTIYIVLLIVIQFFSSALGIINYEISKEFIISWIVATTVFVSQMLTHVIIMCEALSKQQEHMDFLRVVQEIEDCFKLQLKMNVKKSTIIQQIRSTVIILTVISKSCLMIFALNFCIHDENGYFWWALVGILAMRFRFLQLIVYVEILKYYMLGLNQKLNQVVSLKTERSKQLLDIDYKHLHSMEIIKNIKHIYARIYEASTLVNEFAQASLFAASGSNFLDFTCHLYWTLLVMDNLLSFHNVISSLVTMFPLALFLLKFCHSCQVIKDEVQRTSLLLSRLVCCSACPLITKQYKNLVHDFSLQIMHQRIEFTGKRFFTFDLHCIFAICALIATHLIILVQFTKIDSNHSNGTT